MSNNTKNNNVEVQDKASRSEQRQKRVTQVVCLFLAALMALGGVASAIALLIG